MTERLRVTVLVPHHEQAAYLPRALGSLVDQSVVAWEAIVLEDGSRPDVADLVSDAAALDPRIRVVGWPDNRGLGVTLNAGLDLATTPAVAYLPADDVWSPDHLEALLSALDEPGTVLACSGVERHGVEHLGAPPGHRPQLVQVAHHLGPDRWTERDELESDDLDLLFWHRLRARGRTGTTGRVTCTWTDHPAQRHKAIRESLDGGLNIFRRRYVVSEPLRFHSSDSGTVDEVERYERFRRRTYPAREDGLRVLLVGELAFNPERVLALTERGHRLHGLWTDDGLGDSTVGPLPFGHVQDLPRHDWHDAVRTLRPDVIYGLLNWRAVPFVHEVVSAHPELPFVWHFKESPQRSIIRGDWPLLADLVRRSATTLVATDEERRWFELSLPGQLRPGQVDVPDGDLPSAEWLRGPASEKLSTTSGEPHTVVLGRPIGLDADALVGLARQGVHVHLHGQVTRAGPAQDWQDQVATAVRAAPAYVHLHPPVGPERWVSDLSAYDAGWLHRIASTNRGDLRRASWDDLNTPARLPTLLAAGLPLLIAANPGHVVAVERIAAETGAGLAYEQLDAVPALLADELRTRAAGTAAWQVRHEHTFDAHADRLVEVFRRAAR